MSDTQKSFKEYINESLDQETIKLGEYLHGSKDSDSQSLGTGVQCPSQNHTQRL